MRHNNIDGNGILLNVGDYIAYAQGYNVKIGKVVKITLNTGITVINHNNNGQNKPTPNLDDIEDSGMYQITVPKPPPLKIIDCKTGKILEVRDARQVTTINKDDLLLEFL